MDQQPVNQSKSQDELNWAVLAHLSSFLAAWAALGVLGPLCVWLVKGNDSDFVRQHAVAAVNFNLTALAVIFAGWVLVFFAGIGLLVLAGIGLLYAIDTIRGALAARSGQSFKYTFAINFLK